MNNIVAGIVLYNPDLQRLDKNINAVFFQVDKIIFYDNGSKNIKQISSYLDQKNINYELITSEENLGIAHALNELCKSAEAYGYKWILTLDQDTVISDKLIKNYKNYLTLPNLGQLSCVYKDRNSAELKDEIDSNVVEVKECITSGALLNINAAKVIGGFDENMFIDYVDFDLCYALRNNGYKTYRISYIGMLHEIGHITSHNFLGKRVEIFNQSVFRHYYRCRNFILFTKRYKLYTKKRAIFIQFKTWIKVLLYENNKVSKTKAMFKGLRDGLKMDVVRRNYFN